MAPIKELSNGHLVAWSPIANKRSVLAVADCDRSGSLELVNLGLHDPSRKGYEVLCRTAVSDPLKCMEWSAGSADISGSEAEQHQMLGLLASGSLNGCIQLWNPAKLLATYQPQDDTDRSRGATGRPTLLPANTGGTTIFTSPSSAQVTTLSFNGTTSPLFAAGFSDGAVTVFDPADTSSPETFEPSGAANSKTGGGLVSGVTAIAWNQSVQGVVAVTCSNGSTTIWNQRQKRASIKFRDPAGRMRPSGVAWLPSQATQVIVAYDDDTNPSFQMWDLRNSTYPFKEFPGHSRGIQAIRFSDADPRLMVSCGKDNRTVCWAFDDILAPSMFSELTTTEYQSTIRWAPHLPGLIASTSHVQGVLVDSIQERTNPAVKHIPSWFHQRKSGLTVGFGGKLVSFDGTESYAAAKLSILPSTNPELIREADQFEETLMSGDYPGYCQRRIRQARDSHDCLTWQVVQTLFYPFSVRSKMLVEHLGHHENEIQAAAENFLGAPLGTLMASADPTPALGAPSSPTAHDLGQQFFAGSDGGTQRVPPSSTGGKPYTGTVGGAAEGLSCGPLTGLGGDPVVGGISPMLDAETFFNELGDISSVATPAMGGLHAMDPVGRTASGAASPGPPVSSSVATHARADCPGPLDTGLVHGSDDSRALSGIRRGGAAEGPRGKGGSLEGPGPASAPSGADLLIRRTLLVGNKYGATELCICAGRWADAMLFAATSGDSALWNRTKDLYLRKASSDRFFKLMGCVVNEQWMELVQIADLASWDEALALLASYSPEFEFPALSVDLGRRLEREKFDIRAAVVCYLAAGNFDAAAQVWNSLAVSNSRGKSSQMALQELVEKLTILRKATGNSSEDALFSSKISQYAEILANSGRLVAAMKFLCLVDSGEAPVDQAGRVNATAVLRDRIYNSAPGAMQNAGISSPATPAPFGIVDVPALYEAAAVAAPSSGNYAAPLVPTATSTTRYGVGAAPLGRREPIAMGASGHLMHTAAQQLGAIMPPYGIAPSIAAPPPTGAAFQLAQQPPSVGALLSAPPPRAAAHTSAMAPPMTMPPRPPYAPPAPPMVHHVRPPQHAPPSGTAAAGFSGGTPAYPQHLSGVAGPPLLAPPRVGLPPTPGTLASNIADPSVPRGPPPPSYHQPPYHQPAPPPRVAGGHPPPHDLYTASTGGAPQPQGPAGSRDLGASARPPPAAFGAGARPQPWSAAVASTTAPHHPPYGMVHGSLGATESPHRFPEAAQSSTAAPPRPQDPPGRPSIPPFSQPPPAFGPQGSLTAVARPAQAPLRAPPQPAASAPPAGAPPAAPQTVIASATAQSPNALISSSQQSLLKSTAPAAGAIHVPAGMPMPWPIPTATQQANSGCQSTAPVNQRLHEILQGNKPEEACPMPAEDLAFVQTALGNMVEQQAAQEPHNLRKHEEQRAKMQELFAMLRSGVLGKSDQTMILQFVRALESGNQAAATQIQTQLTRTRWTKENRNWLMALKRLITK